MQFTLRPSPQIATLLLAFGALFCSFNTSAQDAKIFHGADLKLGQKLLEENECVACHQTKVGGDGNAIYRPNGKINTASLLRGMVENCNTQLSLGFFPEEVNAIAAVLNRDYYKFKD